MQQDMERTTVLVLDGNQRSALSATRALGRRGARVVVGETLEKSLAAASRHCAAAVSYTNPLEAADAAAADIASIVEREQVNVLLPMTDVSTHLVLLNADLFDNVNTAMPALADYDFASDKIRAANLAREAGIPLPASVEMPAGEDIDLSDALFDSRVVMKPGRSRLFDGRAFTTTAVRTAASRADVERWIDSDAWFRTHPWLAQEFVEGHGEGVFTIWRHGEPLAWFAHRRLREKPPAGGVSVLSESRAVPEELQYLSERILAPLGWHGPAMIEYRVARDGTPYFMEINARFWGSLELGIRAGIDFPALACRIARGERPAFQVEYAEGVRNRWLLGDLDHLYLVLRSREASPGVKLRAILAFLNFFDPRTRLEVLRLSDARPFLRELRHYLRGR